MAKVIKTETRQYAGTWETKCYFDDGTEEWVTTVKEPKDMTEVIKIADARKVIVIEPVIEPVRIEDKYTPFELKDKLSKMMVTEATTWVDIENPVKK